MAISRAQIGFLTDDDISKQQTNRAKTPLVSGPSAYVCYPCGPGDSGFGLRLRLGYASQDVDKDA